jgi:hypothetical protein|tara:strand:+ start:1462 stop:2427 length:966 start_codon:yes stop_codon:yes gene_type:complete
MKAIHVNWTKPFFEKHRLRGHGFETLKNLNSKTYDQLDSQLLYTMVSAANWKKHNGPIKLYTDSIGASFYQRFGLLDLYDEVDINFLNGYSKSNVDAAYFWTSGKIKCLAHQTEPFVFLDQDMIIRDKIPGWVRTNDLTVAHWEIGRGYYYFDKEKFESEITHIPWINNYNVDDWSPNTSFLCFNNMDLLKEYHEWHKKLVTTNGENIPEWFWLLTDQGILGHIIRENDYHVNTLTQKISLSHHNNTNGINRYKGKAEKWYFPTQPSFQELPFEHVWLDKINTESLRNKKYFKELVDELNMSHYLTDVRWSTYWDDYHEKQ